jgi:hypothetical protein
LSNHLTYNLQDVQVVELFSHPLQLVLSHRNGSVALDS